MASNMSPEDFKCASEAFFNPKKSEKQLATFDLKRSVMIAVGIIAAGIIWFI